MGNKKSKDIKLCIDEWLERNKVKSLKSKSSNGTYKEKILVMVNPPKGNTLI